MIIKDFQTFLNERNGGLHKVLCTVAMSQDDHRYITRDEYHVSNYMKLFTKGDKPYKVTNFPIINYCNIHTQKLMDAGTSTDLIYNKIDAKMRVASKIDWHKIHKDNPNVPKTVWKEEDLDQLEFPIIAKPDNRYSGLGIVKFDTLEDAKDADLSDYTVFSEKVDIAEEHRIIFWRGKALMWVQRVPANEETKKMTKAKDDKLKFNYVLKNIDKMPEEWHEVFVPFIDEHNDLDIYSIDLMIDEDGKPWVVEMSSEFGVPFGVMAPIYKEVYQDYYGNKLNLTDEEQIDMYREKDIDATIASDKKRFSVEDGKA